MAGIELTLPPYTGTPLADISYVTAREVIYSALKLIGVLSAGESPTGDEIRDSLDRLNDLIEQWQIDRLMIYQITRSTFDLVADQQDYTLGDGGDFDIARPAFLADVKLVSGTGETAMELPLELYTRQRWLDITMRAMTATYPQGVWFNPNYPLAELWFWPIPSDSTLDVALYLPSTMPGPVGLDSSMSLPPGYRKALRYQLAIELAPEFGRPVTPILMKTAADAKAAILSNNADPVELRCDPALRGDSGHFNIWTGGFRR